MGSPDQGKRSLARLIIVNNQYVYYRSTLLKVLTAQYLSPRFRASVGRLEPTAR